MEGVLLVGREPANAIVRPISPASEVKPALIEGKARRLSEYLYNKLGSLKKSYVLSVNVAMLIRSIYPAVFTIAEGGLVVF